METRCECVTCNYIELNLDHVVSFIVHISLPHLFPCKIKAPLLISCRAQSPMGAGEPAVGLRRGGRTSRRWKQVEVIGGRLIACVPSSANSLALPCLCASMCVCVLYVFSDPKYNLKALGFFCKDTSKVVQAFDSHSKKKNTHSCLLFEQN